jgi:hypothetical protein
MRCGRCGEILRVYRLNPERARVEPYCHRCGIHYETAPHPLARRCPECGLDFATIRFAERLGCFRCYDTFRDQLLDMMAKERGRKPPLFERPAPSRAALARHRLLQDMLQEAANPTDGKENQLPAYSGERTVAESADDEIPSEQGTGADRPMDPATEAALQPEAGELVVRIRVARNLPDIPYLSRLPDFERGIVEDFLLADGSSLVRFFEDRSEVYRTVRHGSRRLSADGRFEIRCGDEDHLRMAFFLHLPRDRMQEWQRDQAASLEEQIVKDIQAFEDEVLATILELDRHLWFQAHPLFGFLTACPSNAGSGIRMSLRFRHPSDPAVWLTELASLRSGGLSLRGSAGEGSAILGSATVLLPFRDVRALRRVIRVFLRTL